MTFVILLGGIDLSVGPVLALATIVAGKTVEPAKPCLVGLAIVLAVLASIAYGALWLI